MQPRDLGLLVLVHVLLPGQALILLPPEMAVVALVDGQTLVFQVGDGIRHGVQKVAVMADQQDGPLVALQKAFQPFGRRDVQVVGRLVQNQQVGPGQDDLRQGEPRLLAAGTRPDALAVVGRRKPQFFQHERDVRLVPVAACRFKRLAGVRIRLHRRFQGVIGGGG